MESENLRLSRGSERATYATRGWVAKTPYFPETISCPVLFLGESGDSGRSPAFDERRKDGESRAISERFTGRDRGVVPDQGSGLKTRDSGGSSNVLVTFLPGSKESETIHF